MCNEDRNRKDKDDNGFLNWVAMLRVALGKMTGSRLQLYTLAQEHTHTHTPPMLWQPKEHLLQGMHNDLICVCVSVCIHDMLA